MSTFPSLLIAVDLTPMDEALMRYVKFWLDTLPGEPEVHIVHNIKYNLDDDMEALLDAPLDQVVQEALGEQAKEWLPGHEHQVQIHVKQAYSTMEAIKDCLFDTKASLLVLGKKIDYDGSGITNSKMLRQSPVPVLLVPEMARRQLNKLLVPIDFSKQSAAALRKGLSLQEELGNTLEIQHIYHIPSVYFPYVPVQSMSRSMLEKAKKEFNHFVEKHTFEQPLPGCTFTDGKEQSVVDTLDRYSRQQQVDLIIVGAQGHSALLGSVAIGLSRLESPKPILIV